MIKSHLCRRGGGGSKGTPLNENKEEDDGRKDGDNSDSPFNPLCLLTIFAFPLIRNLLPLLGPCAGIRVSDGNSCPSMTAILIFCGETCVRDVDVCRGANHCNGDSNGNVNYKDN